MADTRTLKLSLLADVNKFLDGMNKAETGTKSLGSKVGKYSKAMAGAFLAVGAAAGVMAVKIGVDSVKAAIEDEKSQATLAQALKNTTKATNAQIKSSEDWIYKQQISYGISDSKLRPALANLARATSNVEKAQKLTNLAMDISAATGKDVESVSLALAKAYNGNFGALTKLGIPLDANIVKTKDFNALTEQLNGTFGGSAYAATKTYAGQLEILKVRFDEIKESLGARLIPKLKDFLEALNLVAMGFGGEDPNKGLTNKVKTLSNELTGGNKGGAYNLGKSLKEVADAFGLLFGALAGSNATKGNDNLQNFADAVNSAANAINWLATAYGKLDKFTKSKGYQTTLDFLFGPDGGFGQVAPGTKFGNQALGGPVSGTHSYLVGERGPEIFTPNVGGKITPNGAMGGGTVINLNGIVDAESARRSIEQLIQRSARRTGAIDWVGATL
jgi:hypothetical protein